MNSYELKQQARKERLERAAQRMREKSDADCNRAVDMLRVIPMGQPILIGHHSEKGHRALLKRSDNAMRRSIHEHKMAERLQERADGVGHGGISSDDPQAAAKLTEQAEGLEKLQARMVDTNKAWRICAQYGWDAQAPATRINPNVFVQGAIEKLRQAHGDRAVEYLMTFKCPHWGRQQPFAAYQLQNNNANIRRIKQRIAQLAKRPTEDKVIERFGYEEKHNAEENRVQLMFKHKPVEETRKMLKYYGFRWAPSQKAWQRQLNNAGIYAANQFAKWMEDQINA